MNQFEFFVPPGVRIGSQEYSDRCVGRVQWHHLRLRADLLGQDFHHGGRIGGQGE